MWFRHYFWMSGVHSIMYHTKGYFTIFANGKFIRVINWIKSFLTHRSTTLKTSEYITEKLAISTGIPQGSPLSPILYLFYNADLIDECIQLDPNIKASGFIDDVMLLAIRKSLEVTCGFFFPAHQVCLKWVKTHGSKFAPKKYQLVHLTRRQKDNCERELDLGESGIIKGAKVGRLLGVLIDNKLS